MSSKPKPRVLLMHPILDPGPAILAEAAEVVDQAVDDLGGEAGHLGQQPETAGRDGRV